jgi:antitoxin (DNA-binding transcriptional repressor) of toxin-antitoxin stability system
VLSFSLEVKDMQQVSVEEAKTTLPDLIDAAVSGDDVVITKDEQHIVKLVPVTRVKAVPQFGSAKGLITIADDFDEPLDDLRQYME